MSKQPTISVIVPVYNAEKYLERCVNSLLCQSYPNIEILLINDGSKDSSGTICEAFARKDLRVIVKHCTNQGVSAARNEGLIIASGEYVSFVDSDDYLKPRAYETLIARAISYDADVVACDYCMVINGEEYPSYSFAEGKDKNETISNMIKIGPRGGNIFSFILVRNSLLKENSLLFPCHLSWAEDFWFTLHAYVKARVITKVQNPLYCYNFDNDCSATHNEPAKALIDKKKCLEECIHFLKDNALWERFEKEMSWRVLLDKTQLVLSPSSFEDYYSFLPEVNKYVEDNPLLSPRMKLLMKLLNNKQKLLASCLVKLYQLKNS